MSTDVFTCEQKLLKRIRSLKPAEVEELRNLTYDGLCQLAEAIDALVEADLEKLSSGWEEE
jgi:hypothetical protein